MLLTVACVIARVIPTPELAASPVVEDPLVFTDEAAEITDASAEGGREAEMQLLTKDGWQDPERIVVRFADGRAAIEPLGEGINIVRFGADEVRFLAFEPPPALDVRSVRDALPRSADRLFDGGSVRLLAMGDSVTATGSYAEILRRMLARATGNPQIHLDVRAFPGCSVDASVRTWEREAAPTDPHIGLIMYGLNEQAAGVPMAAYVEQLKYLVAQLAAEDADAVLLEPTPHINILPPSGDATPASIFRTISFAAAANRVGSGLDVPVVPTFDALWQEGAADLEATARKLWPMFPRHSSHQLTSMIETGGKGDTIHPNALGHLVMAKAAFNRINGVRSEPALTFAARTVWRGAHLTTVLTVRNASDRRSSGTLALYPIPQDEFHATREYSLAPGASAEFSLVWPGVSGPTDLLDGRYGVIFGKPGPFLQVVHYRGDESQVSGVHAPLEPGIGWVRERRTAETQDTFARFRAGEVIEAVAVHIPEGSEVGRIPLRRVIETGGRHVPTAAELAYVRYATAGTHEVNTDGVLDEWSAAEWIPVGEPVQARWTEGIRDFREHPGERYLYWAFSAGKEGVHVAFRGKGPPGEDWFTLYFDPRRPEALGSVGPYYWVDAKLNPGGDLNPRIGDSSPREAQPRGAWKQMDGKMTGELFIPYTVFDRAAWPASGDLGLSIVWQYRNATGKTTRLMWSENGHPWNPRWFGVVRRGAGEERPFMIRVR